MGCTIELYAESSGISGGTSITPRNNNRNSTTASEAIVLLNPTVTTLGTRVSGYLAGAGRSSGVAQREHELILKRNTTYTLVITSISNSNNISWDGEWYEHDPLC